MFTSHIDKAYFVPLNQSKSTFASGGSDIGIRIGS